MRATFLAIALLAVVPAGAQQRPAAILQDGHDDLDADLLGSIFGDRLVTLSETTMLVWDLPSRTIVDRFDIPPIIVPHAGNANWWPWRIDYVAADEVTLWLSPTAQRNRIERPLPLTLSTHRYGAIGAARATDVAAAEAPAERWSIEGTHVYAGPEPVGTPQVSILSTKPALQAADVSADGGRIALLLGGIDAAKPRELRVLDASGLRTLRTETVAGGLNRVTMLPDGRVLAWPEKQWWDSAGTVRALVIDPAGRAPPLAHDARCAATVSLDAVLAFGPLRCTGAGDDALWRAQAGRPGWTRIELPELGGRHVIAMAGAAQAARIVLVSCPGPLPASRTLFCKRPTLHLYRTDTGRIAQSGKIDVPLSPQGGRLALSDSGVTLQYMTPQRGMAGAIIVRELPVIGEEETFTPAGRPRDGAKSAPVMLLETNLAGDDQLSAGFNATRSELGGDNKPIDGQVAGRGGQLPEIGIWWAPIKGGVLRFWRQGDDKVLADLVIQRNGYSVLTPYGTYDTSGRADGAGFRWKFAGEDRSLPPQMFMRDYFEPDLLKRRLGCTKPDNCDTVFRPAPDIASLNRVLPTVAINDIVPIGDGRLRVSVTAHGNGRSGLYNLRLFRDDRLIAQVRPIPGALSSTDRAAWRRATEIQPPGMTDGRTFTFDVQVPAGATKATFSAYAFNEDQVKSDSAVETLSLAPSPPRAKRLYLLTIGIDFYGEGGFPSLRYAGADADALADLLKRIGPGFEVHAESVIGTAARPATRARVRAAIERLRAARPDDTVIITYAGHGHTDAQGRFSLVPSDARRIGNAPDPATLIAAGDLSDWLEPVDAGEIAFVIDACHSAASVSGGGFKPGPMGDPGLGQLAYDKGIRILAASQPDEYAMELSSVGHGLLTYALLNPAAADADGDGFVRLDELLQHGAAALAQDQAPALGGEEEASLLVDWGRDVKPARQKPSLFDYVGHPATAGWPTGG